MTSQDTLLNSAHEVAEFVYAELHKERNARDERDTAHERILSKQNEMLMEFEARSLLSRLLTKPHGSQALPLQPPPSRQKIDAAPVLPSRRSVDSKSTSPSLHLRSPEPRQSPNLRGISPLRMDLRSATPPARMPCSYSGSSPASRLISS